MFLDVFIDVYNVFINENAICTFLINIDLSK